MAEVGAVYSKLVKFLEASGALNPPAAEQPTPQEPSAAI